MSEAIVNKVASSGLVTLDLEEYLPGEDALVFDLKPFLFMELILKEKDFREALKNLDWTGYAGKAVAITCSADAIIPAWAYMLVASYLQPLAAYLLVGTAEELEKALLLRNLQSLPVAELTGQRIVVKGCGDKAIGPFAYAEATRLLRPVVKSIMYGEPCSTVPIYKAKS